MTTAFDVLLATLHVVAFLMFLYSLYWFGVSLLAKRQDIADIAWGLGIALIAAFVFTLQVVSTPRMELVATLILIWGLRLATHIMLRSLHKSEDPRYRKWREEWGKTFYLRSYLQVFLLQALLMILVAYPAIHVSAFHSSALTFLDLLGALVWLVGFAFETIGDWQLARFIKNPTNKGRIMQSGLWRYTRHPNYFGEVTLWWGIGLIALSVPYGYIALIGPLTITYLILKVSGIPMLEKHWEGHPEWAAYKAQTSSFFPLPPKSTTHIG